MRYHMYKLNKALIIGAVGLMAAACGTKTETTSEAEATMLQTHEAEAIDVLYPLDVQLVGDSNLVVYEGKNQAGFLQVYNLDGKKIAEIGNIGDGPDEFINPRLLESLNTADAICIGDLRRIAYYDMDSVAREGYAGREAMTLGSDFRLYNYFLVNNDSVAVIAQTGEHPLTRIDKSTGDVSYIDYFPDVADLSTDPLVKNMELFANSATSRGDRIALAYSNFNVVAVLDVDGREVKIVKLPQWDYNAGLISIDNNRNIKKDADARLYFTKVKSTPDYIFALGWNETNESMKAGTAKSSIYQIDWDGNVVGKFDFDRMISNFAVAPDNKIAYAVGMGDDGELHVFEVFAPTEVQ